MTTSEKIAYLKGLADGLGLDKDSKQDKLIGAIIDVLDAVAQDIESLEENALDLGEEIDAISEDLADVERLVYEDFDEYDDYDGCCCDDDCCCGDNYDDCCDGHHHHHDDDCCGGHNHHHENEGCCGGHHHHESECCCGHHDEPVFYEVTCPACNNTITVDEDVLALKTIQCPNCGETLEFDLDSIEYEDEISDKE